MGDAPRLTTRPILVVMELEVPLSGPDDLDDQRQCLPEEGLKLVLLAQVEQPPVEVALPARLGQLRARWLIGHLQDF